MKNSQFPVRYVSEKMYRVLLRIAERTGTKLNPAIRPITEK